MRRAHPLTGKVGTIEAGEVRTGGATGIVGSFGYTRKNTDGTPKQHKGIDLLSAEGNPVYAAHNGRVRRMGWENPLDKAQGYGLRIYLEGTDYETRYAHLSEIQVKPGDLIHVGRQIGLIGRTGNISATTPTHLHFEVWDQDGDPTDPVLWLVEEEGIA